MFATWNKQVVKLRNFETGVKLCVKRTIFTSLKQDD